MNNLPVPGVRPLHNQVIVLRDEPPKQIGLIILPDITRERLAEGMKIGTVLAIGPGRYVNKPGSGDKRVPMFVERGDRVIFHQNAGSNGEIHLQDGTKLKVTTMWDDELEATLHDEQGIHGI